MRRDKPRRRTAALARRDAVVRSRPPVRQTYLTDDDARAADEVLRFCKACDRNLDLVRLLIAIDRAASRDIGIRAFAFAVALGALDWIPRGQA